MATNRVNYTGVYILPLGHSGNKDEHLITLTSNVSLVLLHNISSDTQHLSAR